MPMYVNTHVLCDINSTPFIQINFNDLLILEIGTSESSLFFFFLFLIGNENTMIDKMFVYNL